MLYQDKRYEVFNLGNSYPIKLSEMINTIESVLQKNANINYLPEQIGDVPATLADISKAQKLLGYFPTTSFKEGIRQFISWKAHQG
jgi:UDP-glucuronate 4-epimerase